MNARFMNYIELPSGHAVLFAASALFAGIAAFPATAGAYATYHASQCTPICDGPEACPTTAGVGLNSAGQYLNTGNLNLDIACPATLMNDSDPRYVTQISLTGWANENGVDFGACRTYAGGGGGRCGAFSGSPTHTVFNTSIGDLSAWTSGGLQDGYFIYVDLPQTSNSGSHNVLFSYYIAG